MQHSNQVWELIGYVNCSKYRTKIIRLLNGQNMTPTEIADELDIKRRYVYKTLKELRDNGAIICVNPDKHKHKKYTATEEGKEAIEALDGRDLPWTMKQ